MEFFSCFVRGIIGFVHQDSVGVRTLSQYLSELVQRR